MSDVVKWFSSDMQGAPQVTNDWGVLIPMLDACLITGFNNQTVSGITRDGTTVTATFSGGGHGFVLHQVILVSGASESEYNGEHRVTGVTGTTVTFEVVGSPATPATGTISAKAAPLGFEKPFSGTDKAVYRSPNMSGTRLFLRVDNSLAVGWDSSWAKFAKVTMADAMSGVDVFTGSQAPYDPLSPDKNHLLTGSGLDTYNGWAKWYYAKNTGSRDDNTSINNGNRKWVLIGDDRGFYLSIAWQPAGLTDRALYAFGDYNSLIPDDPYAALLQSRLSYGRVGTNDHPWVFSNAELFSNNTFHAVLLKPAGGVGDFVYAGGRSLGLQGIAAVSGRNQNPNIAPPNPTGSLNLFCPVYLLETNSTTTSTDLRGTLRGAFWCLMRQPYADEQFVEIEGSDRIYMALNYYSSQGLVLFDITGAW
ncbi:MAG: hypothetical protein VXW65_11905 [Pseudomonadota bacterium]|nr:hypothetical protein [Pseudomonadota bacterium]